MPLFAFYFLLCSSFLCNFASAQNEIVKVDLLTDENAKSHRTSDYEIVHDPTNPSLVIRRGQAFYLLLHLRQAYNGQRDKIRLEFKYGECHQ